MSGFQGCIVSLVAGLIVGIIFQLVYLPIPAPGNIPGFMGIVGIWSGSYITQRYFKKGGRK